VQLEYSNKLCLLFGHIRRLLTAEQEWTTTFRFLVQVATLDLGLELVQDWSADLVVKLAHHGTNQTTGLATGFTHHAVVFNWKNVKPWTVPPYFTVKIYHYFTREVWCHLITYNEYSENCKLTISTFQMI